MPGKGDLLLRIGCEP